MFIRLLIVIFLAIRMLLVTDVEAFQYPKHVNPPERRSSPSRDSIKAYDRVKASTNVFKSIMSGKNPFPQQLLDEAKAIAVFPAKLNYSPVTGHNGSGIVCTRDVETGLWQPPIFINLSGENLNQYFNGGNDLILFAINSDAMKAFFTDSFKPVNIVTSQELLGSSIKDASTRFHFVAYSYNQESLTIANVENSTIKHDGALNFAVYGVRQIKPYLPTSKQISNRVLTFPVLLNSYNKKT